jgi:hypothetical protein
MAAAAAAAAAANVYRCVDHDYTTANPPERVPGSKRVLRRQEAPSPRVVQVQRLLHERDEANILVSDGKHSFLYLWPLRYRLLLDLAHLHHTQRFQLLLFMHENGYSPRTIVEVFKQHGAYDLEAWRGIFGTLDDLLSGEQASKKGGKYPVFNMREQQWVKATYDGIGRARSDWVGDRWWRKFMPNDGPGLGVEQTLQALASAP